MKIKAGQPSDELNDLIAFVKAMKFKSFLEVGSRFGGTFYRVVQAMPKTGGPYVAVDLPEAIFGKTGSADHLSQIKRALVKQGWTNTSILLGDSRDPAVIAAVESHAPFDFIFIDGDHRFEGVSADFKNYGHMGRYVGFHDIDHYNHIKRDPRVGVPRFWADVKKNRKDALEIIGSERRGYGVGIIKL
jgi:cephalosporin hydroxylase